jgi:molybdopterin synthase catalytic subunit
MTDVQLTRDPIDYAAVVERVRSTRSGAVVLFLGTVREMSEGRSVDGLTYEAHVEMARRTIEGILDEAAARWPLDSAAVVHRWGELALGDVAVAVAAASAHRAPAFESARWIMDRIKESAPIWKQEHWRDGGASWVHPAASERPDRADAAGRRGPPHE